MKIYDLTHKTENNMTAYSLEEKPDIKNLFAIKKDGFNVTSLGLSSHLGTHIDVPFHMIENGKISVIFLLNPFWKRENVFHLTNCRILIL